MDTTTTTNNLNPRTPIRRLRGSHPLAGENPVLETPPHTNPIAGAFLILCRFLVAIARFTRCVRATQEAKSCRSFCCRGTILYIVQTQAPTLLRRLSLLSRWAREEKRRTETRSELGGEHVERVLKRNPIRVGLDSVCTPSIPSVMATFLSGSLSLPSRFWCPIPYSMRHDAVPSESMGFALDNH